jgi:hypothetical protein
MSLGAKMLTPPACKLKNIFFLSYVFYKGQYSCWDFTRISLNRKEIQRVVLIPLMQKFLLRHIYIYLFLRQMRGILKVTIYKGFTYVHCLSVVAGIGVEKR